MTTCCDFSFDLRPEAAGISSGNVGHMAPTLRTEDQHKWRAELLAGVTSISARGSPGRVAVFDPPSVPDGQGAFAVTRDASFNTGIGAAIWGQGRVVAFPEVAYIWFAHNVTVGDTARLYTNCVRWATHGVSKTIKIVTDNISSSAWLSAQGYTNVTWRDDWETVLSDADLAIVGLGIHMKQLRQRKLADCVRQGCGLITSGTGWLSKEHGADLTTMDGNVFLRQAGLSFIDGVCTMNPVTPALELGNASHALSYAKNVFNGSGRRIVDGEEAAAMAILSVVGILPADHHLALEIAGIYGPRARNLSATPATPVSGKLDQSVLVWETLQLATSKPDDVDAHHTAEALYGHIPPSADSGTRRVLLSTSRPRWISTGMYAVPGKVVTIEFPSVLVDKGYSVRIGGHTDDISERVHWQRIPSGISRSFMINSNSIKVASAFGGAIYIDVGLVPPKAGSVWVTFIGAIRAPYFVLGATSNLNWNNHIRNYPAPYAELECEGVIISVPSSWIRNLNDPTELMTFWNDAVRRQDWVAAHEKLRTNPERINLDVQISNGLLHAGYPIQGPTSYNLVEVRGHKQGMIVTLSELKKHGDWGWFHELGHQMQYRPDDSGNFYTFDGDVEVTVNIFANAAQELLVRDSPKTVWGWSEYPDEVMRKSLNEIKKSAAFDWKDKYPFYYQLADGPNGWQDYRDVMSLYTQNHTIDSYSFLGNQQKKDLWLKRWSQATRHNMVEYMVNNWKLEVSQSAIDEVNSFGFPSWMPLASSLVHVEARAGVEKVLSVANAGLSLDGIATVIRITSPSHGSLVNNGNGTLTYKSEADYEGEDSFTTTYRSSAGNLQTFTTTITLNSDGWVVWTMNEGTGDTLHDTGSTGAHGSIIGPVWVGGQPTSALRFDGISTKVSCGTVPSLSGATDFTIVAWVKTEHSGLIIQQRDADGYEGEYMLEVRGNGYIRFMMYNHGYQFDFDSIARVNDGQWHKVVAQREDEMGRIYIDDMQAGTAHGPVKALDAELSVTIGYDSLANSKYFNGDIGGIRIYDNALARPFLSPSGLSSFWKMDEGSGSSVLNYGASGGKSTVTGEVTWVEGAPKYALHFDGVHDYVSFGHDASLDGITDFTIFASVKTRGGSGIILQQRDENGYQGEYMLEVLTDGSVYFMVYNGWYQFSITTKAQVSDGQWHKIVAQREGENGRVFVDGQLSGSGSGAVKALRRELGVVMGRDSLNMNRYFNGVIDEVRIYKHADAHVMMEVYLQV